MNKPTRRHPAVTSLLSLALACLLLTIIVATCRRFDNPFDPANNRPPDAPANPAPADGAERLSTSGIDLSWTCTDPDSAFGDTLLTYSIHFGADSNPPLADTGLTTPSWNCGALTRDVSYRWRVIARDSRGATTSGPIWSFTTGGNLPPFEPSQPSPGNGATGRPSSVRLSWQGGDPDSADAVVYDLYFGTADPPPLVATGLPTSEWTASSLDHSTDYYWRVVARDQGSLETSGPLWRFSTMSAIVFVSPAGGEKWRIGTVEQVRWSGGSDGKGMSPTRHGNSRVLESPSRTPGPELPAVIADADSTVLYRSTNSGATWQRVGPVTTPGQYQWSVTGPAAAGAMLQVRAYLDVGEEHAASAVFTTYNLPTPIAVTRPAAGARWEVGSNQAVRWTGGEGITDSTVVHYSSNNGRAWSREGRATEPGLFNWVVREPETESALIRVNVHIGPDSAVGQSARFAVIDTSSPTPPTVTSPAGGETWEIGSVQEVTWSGGTGADSSVVYYSPRDGANWQRQGRATAPGRFDWTVPGPETDSARIRVLAWHTGQSSEGISNRFRTFAATYPDTVIATITVGERPIALAWNSTNNKLYVANRNSGTVSVIDGESNTIIATIPVDNSPTALVWDSVHNKVFCANEGSRSVTVIDGAADSVQATLNTARLGPRELCVNPASGKVYVANYGSGANAVTIINAATNTVISNVSTGQRPRALAWNPGNNRVFVACFSANSASVIDGESNAVVDSIGVGWSPIAVTVAENLDHVYIANSGATSNSVTVIDAASGNIVTHVAVGTKPTALAWNRSSSKIYVANEDAASVSVIRTTDRQVIAVIGVGVRPNAVAWSARGNKAYVACRGSAEVALIDGTSDSREKLLRVGNEPIAVIRNHAGSRVYVANYADGTVSVIGTR